MSSRYNVNDTVTLRNLFKVSAVLTDPTTISLAVTNPAGTTTTYTYAAAQITRNSLGDYQKNVTADSVGIWRYTWTGTGTAADVQDDSFTVFAVADLTVYATLEQLRDELGNYTSTDLGDDAKLQRSLNAASRQIDRWCGQRFWQDQTAVARTFAPADLTVLDVTCDDGAGISTATGLIVKLDYADTGAYATTLTYNTDFLLLPVNAAAVNPALPYTAIRVTSPSTYFPRSLYGRYPVQVTAKWGWPAVPDEVTKACLIQASDLFKSKDASFGVAGVADFGPLRVRSGLNMVAQGLLAPFRIGGIG